MRRRAVLRALGLAGSAGLLAGCGFQLRGRATLPPAMARTRIDAPLRSRELVSQLRRLLDGNGVTVVEAGAADAAVLEIVDERLDRQVQSVGPTARVREFALEYRVTYRVLDPAGGELIAPRDLLLVRDYTFDQNQVLGTTAEEELIGRELRREMATRIVASMSAG